MKTLVLTLMLLPIVASAQTVQFEDFMGAERCGQCHAAQFEVWRNSTHGNAGGKPSSATTISEFDGTTLTFSDATVRMQVKAGEYFYHVEEVGKPSLSLRIAGLVGGGHMLGGGTQTSFAAYSDGSWRLLPFDYSSTNDAWFCDTRRDGWQIIDPELAISDCKFWPPVDNFAPNCGNCHSSQMQVTFDRRTGMNDLRFADLAINCESCHGPGRQHLELVSSKPRTADIGMQPLDLLDKEASVRVCMQCHALTQQLAPGYLPGKAFDDFYSLEFVPGGRRFADGRVKEFGYQEGHLSSDCYVNGSMTCVDCHDPHSQNYRDVDYLPLPGKLDDGQCTDCHAAKLRSVQAHTGHPVDSAGSRCVSCHMPFLQHGGLGNEIAFTRSDHTIPSPRPALDAALGLESACDSCHESQDTAWQEAAIEALHGARKPHKPIVAELLGLEQGAVEEARRAFTSDFPAHPTATVQLLRVAGEMLGLHRTVPQELRQRLVALSQHRDLDVRTLAKAYLIDGPVIAKTFALVNTAERRRIASWLEYQGRSLVADGELQAAAAKLEAAFTIDPHPALALVLADTQRIVGDIEGVLRVLGAAYSAGSHYRSQHLRIVDGLCEVFDLMTKQGGKRSASITQLCAAASRAPATPD